MRRFSGLSRVRLVRVRERARCEFGRCVAEIEQRGEDASIDACRRTRGRGRRGSLGHAHLDVADAQDHRIGVDAKNLGSRRFEVLFRAPKQAAIRQRGKGSIVHAPEERADTFEGVQRSRSPSHSASRRGVTAAMSAPASAQRRAVARSYAGFASDPRAASPMT